MDAVTPFPVALVPCADYEPCRVADAVCRALDASGFSPKPGCRILIKPNLLRADPLTCTHPLVTAAVCARLLDQGAVPTVADSPGFGTAAGVARRIGLEEALRPLGLRVQPFTRTRAVPLRRGGSWGVARAALEADVVLSLPRVKAHAQLGLTLAVKNLFGCVVGLRKPLAHTLQGNRAGDFTAAFVDVLAALPPVVAVADGVTAMHVTGPSGGRPFPLGCIAASVSAAALDTALYGLLGATPAQVPLWAALQEHDVPGSRPEDVVLPLAQPEAFDAAGFRFPEQLADISFRPLRLARSLCRRLRAEWGM